MIMVQSDVILSTEAINCLNRAIEIYTDMVRVFLTSVEAVDGVLKTNRAAFAAQNHFDSFHLFIFLQ